MPSFLSRNTRECDVCGRRFASEEQLMHHMQNVHGGGQSYDCKECGERFSSMEAMRTHLQRRHGYRGNRGGGDGNNGKNENQKGHRR